MVAAEPQTPFWRRAIGTAVVFLAVATIGAMMFSMSNMFHTSVDSKPSPDASRGESAGENAGDSFAAARRRMVEKHLRGRDIIDPRVLAVMGRVARERFMPADVAGLAYEDGPLPIGLGQTISQPYIVALMTQLARLTPDSRALEVGVGSGYQTAILAGLCKHVYGVEILEPLTTSARERLASLGYQNVTVRCGDGYQGWPEAAPFNAIVVTAAPDHVPQPLIDQLAIGGRLVIPVGSYIQELLLIEKQLDGRIVRSVVAPVVFVPMTGEAEKTRSR